MKNIELAADKKKYEDILLSIEAVTDIHRKYFMVKRTKNQNEVILRYVLIHMMRKYIGWKLEHIADKVGLRHHSSVMHTFKKIDEWNDTPLMYKKELQLIQSVEDNYGKRCGELV